MPPLINNYSDGTELPVHHLPQTDRKSQQSDSTPSIFFLLLLAAAVPAALAIGLVVFNELQVVGVLCGILGLILILARPFWGLLFFVGLLYTRPEELIPQLAGMHFVLIVALTTLIGMTFAIMLQRERFVRSPLLWAMFAFVALAVGSSLTHGNTVTAAMDMGRLLLIVLIVINLVRTTEQHHTLTTVMIGLTAFLAGYSIYRYFTGQAMIESGFNRSTVTGIFGDPNDLASTIIAGLALSMSRISKQRPAEAAINVLLALVMIAAIFLTKSRGGFLALLFVFALFGWQVVKRHLTLAIPFVIVVAGIFFLGAHGHMGDFSSSDKSANSRFHFWITGVHELRDNPILGDGYWQFPSHNDGMTAHNTWVLCFAELGLPGYICFMSMLYFCYKSDKLVKQRLLAESQINPSAMSELRGSRIALGGYLAASFWLSHTYSPVLYLLMSLPVTAQSSMVGVNTYFAGKGERFRDFGKIVALSLFSIAAIFALALIMR